MVFKRFSSNDTEYIINEYLKTNHNISTGKNPMNNLSQIFNHNLAHRTHSMPSFSLQGGSDLDRPESQMPSMVRDILTPGVGLYRDGWAGN